MSDEPKAQDGQGQIPVATPDAGNKTNSTTFIQWICLVVAAIGCSAYLSHLRYLGGDGIGKTASLALADAMGGALVVLGVPVLVSFLFKVESRFAVRLVGLCVMSFLNWLGVEERAKPAADFVSEVNARRADWKKDVAEQLQSNGVYRVDLVKAERTLDAVKQKAQKLDGKAKEMGEALFSVNDQMLILAKRYESARMRYVQSGGTDASTIRNLEQLESREAVIKDFGQANEGLLKFLHGIDAHLNAALDKVELTSQQRGQAIQNYKKGASLEVVLAIRELDQEVANDSLAVMNLLRTEWGKWKVQGNAVVFDRSSAATEFNSILGRIAAAGKKQAELQRRFAK